MNDKTQLPRLSLFMERGQPEQIKKVRGGRQDQSASNVPRVRLVDVEVRAALIGEFFCFLLLFVCVRTSPPLYVLVLPIPVVICRLARAPHPHVKLRQAGFRSPTSSTPKSHLILPLPPIAVPATKRGGQRP